MIRRPPRSTLSSSSAASDVYKRQVLRTDLKTRYNWKRRVRVCSQDDENPVKAWCVCACVCLQHRSREPTWHSSTFGTTDLERIQSAKHGCGVDTTGFGRKCWEGDTALPNKQECQHPPSHRCSLLFDTGQRTHKCKRRRQH
eukprot:TRINITY_DN10921_c0_g1_i1.p1 TRINITY_DN10921_c0_g1~~TRINITY_DN10921_c0_g1_i1.p1  ORF type:complete len:142 (+),score=7.78 TRINITY_DN10921_c0_g1_i1:111-536(+)